MISMMTLHVRFLDLKSLLSPARKKLLPSSKTPAQEGSIILRMDHLHIAHPFHHQKLSPRRADSPQASQPTRRTPQLL